MCSQEINRRKAGGREGHWDPLGRENRDHSRFPVIDLGMRFLQWGLDHRSCRRDVSAPSILVAFGGEVPELAGVLARVGIW